MEYIEMLCKLETRENICEKNYLRTFSGQFLDNIGKYDKRCIQDIRVFQEEIISKVYFNMEYENVEFKVSLERKTFNKNVMIYISISVLENSLNDKSEVLQVHFGAIYNLKIKIIMFLNEKCKNQDIFILKDINNEKICEELYIEIYHIETKLRKLFTKYLAIRYGGIVASDRLNKEINEYSKWFRKEDYPTFKRVNCNYCNLDFSKLINLLKLKECEISDDNNSVLVELQKMIDEVSEHYINRNDLLIKIKSLKKEIENNSRNVFEENIEEYNNQRMINEIKIIIDANKIDEKYIDKPIRTIGITGILGEGFCDRWENKISKMRNMVAHNKMICKDLYRDIKNECSEIQKIIKCCEQLVELNISSEEDLEREYLEYKHEKYDENSITNR